MKADPGERGVIPVTDATGGPDPEWAKEVDDADEPTQPVYRFATEFGFMELIPPRPYRADRFDIAPEVAREAALRYMKARFAGLPLPPAGWAEETSEAWVDPDVIRGIERVTGEEYRDGRWIPPQETAAVDEYPEGEREE